MTEPGFAIGQLRVVGSGREPATLAFRRGLNVVAGASNTGKTYVFRLLDWMLGASKFDKDIPQAKAYDGAYLEISANDGTTHTLYRALKGGGFRKHNVPLADIVAKDKGATLGWRHDPDKVETVSGFLLSLSGLWGKKIRRSKSELRSLSFRDVSRLILVDEQRVITEGSPALTGQRTEKSPESAVFGMFLTGQDDSAVVVQEQQEEAKNRLSAEINLLGDLIAEHTKELQGLSVDTSELREQVDRLDAAIMSAAELRAVQQAELDSLSKQRDSAWSALQELSSQKLFLDEQAKRLSLLQQHYVSDRNRLSSALEAGDVYERLPTGQCPVCGHKAETNETLTVDERLQEFRNACTAELRKIERLATDLGATQDGVKKEQGELARRETVLQQQLKESNDQIKNLLTQRKDTAGGSVRTLFDARKPLARALALTKQIESLESLVADKKRLLTERPKDKSGSVRSVDTAMATGFCEVVKQTLTAWRVPYAESVSFDPKTFDIVVAGQNRQSLGKGYRAVTHAAFSISLMRYCRSKGIPHPGVVIIDTPLNPFKGPDKGKEERVGDDVQAAFYSDLAEHTAQDQVIVFENTEPPELLRGRMMYTHFSGNPSVGRAGFFPS